VVFDLAAAHGLSAIERRLTLADYESADEVWLSNAVGGLVKARRG
jgi:branched-subunit amino acid aminotransferase/4-amino-4-deoxychorismate lyase